jgi:hypothetical protein
MPTPGLTKEDSERARLKLMHDLPFQPLSKIAALL